MSKIEEGDKKLQKALMDREQYLKQKKDIDKKKRDEREKNVK